MASPYTEGVITNEADVLEARIGGNKVIQAEIRRDRACRVAAFEADKEQLGLCQSTMTTRAKGVRPVIPRHWLVRGGPGIHVRL